MEFKITHTDIIKAESEEQALATYVTRWHIDYYDTDDPEIEPYVEESAK